MPTARQLIIDAYQTSGIRGIGQPVTDDDVVFGLGALNNDVVDVLKTDLNFPPSVAEYAFNIVANQREYTVGTSGTDIVVTIEPTDVVSVQRNQGGIYIPLTEISMREFYEQVHFATDATVPTAFAFSRGATGYKIVLLNPSNADYEAKAVFTGVVSAYALDDQIDLPSGYYSLLKYKLLSVLAQGNGMVSDAQMAEARAANLMQQITSSNTRKPARLSGSYGGGRYDIISDTVV